VPTNHRRIPVTCDPELSEALARAAAVVGRDVPTARLLRDLAIRGAETVTAEAAGRQAALERLAALSTDPDSGLFDRDVLARVRSEAWRTIEEE
jgi:hypothetical protein